MKKTEVCLLEYPKQGPGVEEKRCRDTRELKDCLKGLGENESVKTRLFVVEDLSRSVIEALGSHFKIDPSFFREHIVDYAWYNTSKFSSTTVQAQVDLLLLEHFSDILCDRRLVA